MATKNPFDLLGDDDNDDPSHLIAIQQQRMLANKALAPALPAKQQNKPVAKLPTKPAPPAQAVRESKGEGGRGRGRGGGRGYGRRAGGGNDREFSSNENSFGNSEFAGRKGVINEADSGRTSERRGGYSGPRGNYDAPRGGYEAPPGSYDGSHGGPRGGRRGGYYNGEEAAGDRPRRVFERHSGTGRGNEYKREGAGRGNWGTPTDENSQVTEEVSVEGEKKLGAEKLVGEEDATDGNKLKLVDEPEEKEAEAKEMTLEEYEKVLEEKRKALEALKTEERKVEIDKDLASMQQLSNKKSSDDIFVKLVSISRKSWNDHTKGSDKDKRKETTEKEERAKKSLSINEFLKPVDGERYYGPGGRGRGRGRGYSGEGSGNGGRSSYVDAPAIEDPSQFPTLGVK